MSKRVLIIIDMQKGFRFSAKKAEAGVVEQIKLARRNGWPIISLEYVDENPLMPVIAKALEGYTYFSMTKEQNDGSDIIIYEAKLFSINIEKVRICGINSPYCVKETARGLGNKVPGINMELSVSACANQHQHHSVEGDLRRIQTYVHNKKNGSKVRVLQ